MTKRSFTFKNGIKIDIEIPDFLSREELLARWTETKMWMSIILDPPAPPEPKTRKSYTYNETVKKKILARQVARGLKRRKK